MTKRRPDEFPKQSSDTQDTPHPLPVLSAMLLLTFVFPLTLALITPSRSPSFLPSLPTQPCLRGGPWLCFLFGKLPLSYIQVASISSPSPTPVSCQTQPSTQPPG